MVTALNVLSAELLTSGGDCTWIEKRIVLDQKIPLQASWRQASLELEASRRKIDVLHSFTCFFFSCYFFFFRIPPPPLPRHFLFKPGGTSPMYCTTSPGYPLTSNTVYSPPPRPLPRNTFSRPAFSLKKPYKHCNWKCAALSAILISVTLLFLLAYFIGESPQVPLPRRFLTSRHGVTKHCMPLSSSSLFYLYLCSKCWILALRPKYAVTAVTVAGVADVSPAHVFPGIPPSFTHWAGPLLFCNGVMTNIC